MIVGTQMALTAQRQIINARDAGLVVDAYVWLDWNGDTDAQVTRALEIAVAVPGFDIPHRLWLDVEQPAGGLSHEAVLAKLETLAYVADPYPVGIYTSRSKWIELTGDSYDFAGLPLWYAHYDGIADFSDWSAMQFGGWTAPTMKQYAENQIVAGISVDLNCYHIA